MKLGLTPQITQPVARPRDIFTRTNGGAKLAQLADGLSQFAPSLQRFGQTIQAGVDEDATVEGQNKAREFIEQGKTYKQAIEQGLIGRHESPFFRLGAYETFGRASAHRYADDMLTKLATSDVAQSTNPADFDKFEGDFRATWTKEHLGDKTDPYFANSFGSKADSLVEEARHNFASSAGARLVKQTGEAFHAEAYATLEDGHTKGLKPEDMAAQLELAAQRQVAAGMNRSVVNQLLSSAIDAAAKGVNDASILKVKHAIKLGSGSLQGTSYGSAGTEQAENEIAAVNQTRAVAEREEAKAKKQQAMSDLTGELVTAVSSAKSPLTVDIKPFLDRAVALGEGDKVTTLINIQDAIANREYQNVPAVEQRLYIGVHTGETTMAHLDDALASKAITFATYSKLSDDIKERDKAGAAAGAEKQAVINNVRSRFRSLFVAEFGDSSVEERYRAEQASSEGVFNYLKWIKTPEGQNSTADKKEEWVHNEVMRQFGLKSSSSNAKLLDKPKFPQSEFSKPPQVNPKKAPAAPPETYHAISQGFERVQQGGRYTSQEIAALKSLGIMPKDVKEFLTQQKKFNP